MSELRMRRGSLETTHRYKPSSKRIVRISRHKTRVDKNSRRRVATRVNARIYRCIAIFTRERSTHQENDSKSRTKQEPENSERKLKERTGVGGRLAPSPKERKVRSAQGSGTKRTQPISIRPVYKVYSNCITSNQHGGYERGRGAQESLKKALREKCLVRNR